ncbi:bacterial Ig-like domain-containing protein [Acholeplasma equifetale]|uniref:bacterial Ig-like domain-containing protein n=1 Tax=Acholeplasma equifetale TaxID=264634 RepID=UPI00047D3CE3|nr:bacterial Ig-like domain-containing protein [Acholeplasma equifetale]
MKKILTLAVMLLSALVMVACGEVNDITELKVNKAPDAYYAVGDVVPADQFTVDVVVNGIVQQAKSINDAALTVTGLVNGNLDTSSVGKKTITITYEGVSVTINYHVADFLVHNYNEFKTAMTQEQGLIVLMDDIVVEDSNGIVVPVGHTKTFELNGHAIVFTANLTGATALITNRGNLTIQDATDINKDGSGTGLIANIALNPDTDWDPNDPNDPFPTYANNTITNLGVLTVESGRIENRTTASNAAAYVIDNNSGTADALVIINGGKIAHGYNFAIRQFANSATKLNKVTVNGGIVEGTRAVWLQLPGSTGIQKAELVVTGGVMKSISENGFAFYSYTFGASFADTKITISGGTFVGYVGFTGGQPKNPTETVEITGGNFDDVFSYGAMTPFIKGGVFKVDPSDYVNSATHSVAQSNGTFVVSAK